MVAFLTLGLTILLSLATSLMPKWMNWSPSRLADQAYSFFVNGEPNVNFGLVLASTIVLITVSVLASIKLFENKELID